MSVIIKPLRNPLPGLDPEQLLVHFKPDRRTGGRGYEFDFLKYSEKAPRYTPILKQFQLDSAGRN